MSRRDFLRYTSIATAAAATPAFLVACGEGGDVHDSVPTSPLELDVRSLAVDFSVQVQRREDLAVLDFGFVNLQKVGSPPKLRRVAAGPALIVLTLPPQHVQEQAILEDAAPPLANAPVKTALARESRLVFVVPDDAPDIGFTTSNLLALLPTLGLNVNSNATAGVVDANAPGSVSGGAATAPRAPLPLETAIELPYRVQISPNQYGRFVHAGDPVAVRGRYELWHTRLATSRTRNLAAGERDAGLRTTRALWTRDDDAAAVTGANLPVPDGDGAIIASQRRLIVKATADFGAGAPPQAPMKVKQLALSALGGWIDAELDVPPTNPSGLERWLQRSAMGRDTRVEIVMRGFAFPFGHRMSLLTLSERRFPPGGSSGPAMLYRSYILIVREPEKLYPEMTDPAYAPYSRAMPFRKVRFLTLKSPALDAPVPRPATQPLLPKVNGKVFRWECEATDRRGRTIQLSPSILWLPEGSRVGNNIPAVDDAYQTMAEPLTPTRAQRFAVAVPRDGGDETTFESSSITFSGQPLPAISTVAQPLRFYPVMKQAEITVEALRAIAGADAGQPKAFAYTQNYVSNGFDASEGKNPREIFLELVGVAQGAAPIVANFSKQADKSGGFVAPTLEIRGLSRLTGPVSEVGAASTSALVAGSGVFNASLTSMMPKLFGCISLADIIGNSSGQGGIAEMTPRFIAQALTDGERLLDTGKHAVEDLQRLWDGLPDAIAHLAERLPADMAAALKADLVAHLEAIKNHVQVSKAKILGTVDGLSALTGSIGDPDADIDVLTAQVHAALPDDLFTTIADLQGLLADPLAANLGAYVPGVDALFRNVERLLRGLHDIAADADHAVATLREAFLAFLRGLQLVRDQVVHLEWRPPLRAFGPFKPRKNLLLAADLRAKARGNQKAGVDLLCSLEDFDLDLEVVKLHFNKLQFRQRSGKKPEIDVVLGGLDFGGVLEFVETLAKIIPLDGFSDPPHIDVSPSGLVAGFSVGLPALAVGVFSLEHMAISAQLDVPFLGDSIRFRFAFCSRENPFVVTVAMLGGGGFFSVTTTPKGVTALEASIEFGARLSLNLGVASGSVEIMGGIYFAWQDSSGAMLQGYLRIRGAMDVLGLISASIELRMSLEYWFSEKKVIGRASIEIEIHIVFFSVSVSVSCERRFAGANGDPTFAELVGPLPLALETPHPWLDYWETFATAA